MPLPFNPIEQEVGWSGGATVVGKLPMLGHPANLDYSRARASSFAADTDWGYLDSFSLIYHCSSFFLSLEDDPDKD